MDRSEFISNARQINLTRKQVRSALYDTPLWDERDAILMELGYEASGVAAAREQAERERAEAEAAKAKAEREAAEQAAAEARDRELAEAREAKAREEREALDGIEPHWPTYRQVIDLARDWNEACDAARHRDVGDYLAFRGAGERIGNIAELVLLDGTHSAAKVLEKTIGGTRPFTQPQAKMVALVLAKLATKHGLKTDEPVSVGNAHKMDSATEEQPEQAVAIDRNSPQRIAVRFIASTKAGTKPYMARLALAGEKFERSFIRGRKATNTSKMFTASDLPVGAVLELRGHNWSREAGAYEGGTTYLAVVHGGVLELSRRGAHSVLAGDSNALIDRVTPVHRLHADFLPDQPEIDLPGLDIWAEHPANA